MRTTSSAIFTIGIISVLCAGFLPVSMSPTFQTFDGGTISGDLDMSGNTIYDTTAVLVVGSSTRCTTTNGLGVGAVIFCGAVEVDGVLYADAGVVSTKYETSQLRVQNSTISNIGAGTNITLTPSAGGQVLVTSGLVVQGGNINLPPNFGLATDSTQGTYPFMQAWNNATNTFQNAVVATVTDGAPTLTQMPTTFSGNVIVNGLVSATNVSASSAVSANSVTATTTVTANSVVANRLDGRTPGNIFITPAGTENSTVFQSTITGSAHAPIAIFKQTDVGDAYFSFEWGNIVTSPQNRGHFGYNASTDLVHWTVGSSVIGGGGKDVMTVSPQTQVVTIKKDLNLNENIVMANLKTVDGVDVSALATRVSTLENPTSFSFAKVAIEENKLMSIGESGTDLNIVLQPATAGSVVLAGSTVAQGHISFAPPHGIVTGTSADAGTYNIIQTWNDNTSAFVPVMTLDVDVGQGPVADLQDFVTHDGRAILHSDDVGTAAAQNVSYFLQASAAGDIYTHDASEFQGASSNLTTLSSSSAYFLTLSDDANAAAARTTLGLGNAATSNYIGDTKYVVGASGAPYTTIQSAIDECVSAEMESYDAPCVIKILPGNYTENVALAASVVLEGVSDGLLPSITGTVTADYGSNASGPFNVSASLKNLRINSPSNAYAIDFTGTSAQSLWLYNVRVYKGTGTGKGVRVNNSGAASTGGFTSIVYVDDLYIQGAGTNATPCVEHSAGRINVRGNVTLENPTLATTWQSTGSAVSWQTAGTVSSTGNMTFASSGNNTLTSLAITATSSQRCVTNTGAGTLVLGQFGCSAVSSNTGAAIDASAGVVVWTRGATATLNFASVITGAFGVLSNDALANYFQPLDSDLTSIAALTTTSYGRGLLTQADASAARTYLGVSASSGDVSGPSSSTDNTLAVFNLTTGKVIKEATGITASSGTLTATTLAGTISTATQNSITTLKGVTQLGPDTFGLFYNNTFGVWGIGTTPSSTFSLRAKSLGVNETITAGNNSGYTGAAIFIGNPNANADRHIQYGSAWSVGLDGSTADDFVFSAGASLGSSNRLTLTTGGNLTATGTITGGTVTATGAVNSNYFTSSLNAASTTSGLYIAQANASGDVSLALTSTPNTSSWAIGTRGDQANGTLYFTQSASSVPATARDTSKFSLTTAGNATFAGTISATRFNGYQLAVSGGTQIITIASNKNFTLNNTLTISGADSKTLTVSDNAQVNQDTRTTASPTFTGVTLSDGGTKPTCDATNVGKFFRQAGTTDTIEACAQVSAGTYSWRNLIASGGGGDASTSISSSTDTAIAVFDGTTGKLLKQNAATKLSGASLSFEGTQSSLVFFDTTSSAHDFQIRNDADTMSVLADAGSDGTFELTPFSVTSAGVAAVASSVVVPTITPPSGNLTLDPNAGIVVVDKTFAGHSPAISIRNDELAGDASIRFVNTAATQSWSVGMDGSDNGYFKIGYTASATNNIGTGTMLYIDTSGVAYFTGQVVTPAVSADNTTLDNNTLTSTTTLQIASGASSDLTLKAQNANRLLVGNRVVSVQSNTIFNAFYSATTGASALAITGNVMSLSCSSATTISTLESALYNIVLGTVVVLRFEGPNCTVANTDSGANNTIDLAGSSNFTGTANDTLTLVRVGGAANIWVETSRSVN